MSKRTCSVEGCESPVMARGWCSKHYNRWHNHGDPLALSDRERNAAQLPEHCSVDDCNRPADTKGFCSMHYNRWKRHGDPLVAKRQRPAKEASPCSEPDCGRPAKHKDLCDRHYQRHNYAQRGPCSVDGCETRWQARGLCIKHYHRWRSHGTTDDPAPKPLNGSCSVDGCDKPVKSRGWCGMHVRRWYKWGTTELPERAKMRTCNRCGGKFPLESFTGSVRVCITCWPEWRQETQASLLTVGRRTAGTIVATLRQEQGARCAICGLTEAEAPRKRLHLDHAHDTGQIRGLLCTNCNCGLGQFKDSPELLQAAIDYLIRTGSAKQVPQLRSPEPDPRPVRKRRQDALAEVVPLF